VSDYNEYKKEWKRQDKIKNPEKYKLAYIKETEKRKARYKKWYALNKDNIKAKTNAYYHANKEKVIPRMKKQSKLYRAKNKERLQEKNKKWWEANPDKRVAYLAKRRAKHRMPKWVNKEEKFLITEVYSLAKLRTKMTNIVWHVDHVIPLLGTKVSGLHTIYNLQVIPAKLNQQKNNNYEIVL